MTEQPEREPSKAEKNAPRIEQLIRELWDHRPKSTKAKGQVLAVVVVAGLSFGIGALQSLHGSPAKESRSVVTRTHAPVTPTTDPTPTPTATVTLGQPPTYGFQGDVSGTADVPAIGTSSSSPSPSTTPPIPPEPSPTETTVPPVPAPTTPSTNPSE